MINSLGIIPVDSNFSPVLNVSYSIEDVKITSSSFHEQLNISVATNGSISPEEAISAAGKILTDHLKFFSDLSSNQTDYFAEEVIEEDAQISSSSTAASSQKFTQTKNISTSINDLDLSLRSFNALKRHGINSVSQLTEMTLNQLKGIENLGTKSVKEIKRKLESIGLSFKKSSNN
jgi:DNA-directed RNA polymerase subunit alpha